MSSVFKTQTLLSLKLDTNVVCSAASAKKIYYEKPGGDVGEWDASSIEDGEKTDSVLVYNFTTGDLDQSGVWKFQSYIVIGGKNAPGDIVSVRIESAIRESS